MTDESKTTHKAKGWRVENPTAMHLSNPAYPKGLTFIVRGDCPVIEDGEDWEICLIMGGESADPPDDLDQKVDAWLKTVAHLIAAAPDLYEALRDAVAILKDIGCVGSLIARFDAALSKARGEAQS